MQIRAYLSIIVLTWGVAACSSSPAGPQLTGQQSRYVAALNKIDGRLIGDQARSLQLGATVCAQIAKGRAVDQIAADSQRFTQGEGVIDRKQAIALVEAARKNLCP